MNYLEVYNVGSFSAVVQLLILVPLCVFWLAIIWQQFKRGGRKLEALSGKSMVMAPVLIIFLGMSPFAFFDRFQTWRSLATGEVESAEGIVKSFERQKAGLAFCIEAKCFHISETENVKKIGLRNGNRVRLTHKGLIIHRLEVATK